MKKGEVSMYAPGIVALVIAAVIVAVSTFYYAKTNKKEEQEKEFSDELKEKIKNGSLVYIEIFLRDHNTEIFVPDPQKHERHPLSENILKYFLLDEYSIFWQTPAKSVQEEDAITMSANMILVNACVDAANSNKINHYHNSTEPDIYQLYGIFADSLTILLDYGMSKETAREWLSKMPPLTPPGDHA